LRGNHRMIAGYSRHKIQIKRKELTVDAFGGHIVSYILMKEVWASIDEAGSQTYHADDLKQTVTHYIRMRKFNDYPIMHYIRVSTDMYIFHRGDMFRIVSVKDNDERGIDIVIAAEQVKK
jgi:head-tail adaptor